jgi:23S rRNA (cytosine1962-C5)-methyltransferase
LLGTALKSVRIRRDALPDHPFIFRKQVQRADPGTRNGDPVRILGKDGNPLGAGLYNGKSQIAIRVLTRETSAVVDGRFLRHRIEDAVKLRRELLGLERRTDAYRVVNSEGDGLSGLIVDRYGPVLSVQIKCLGIFRFGGELVEILTGLFPGASIVYRRDEQAEKIEGFRVPVSRGPTEVEILSDGIHTAVNPVEGHKTGSFLDQRDNRLLAASVARGRRVLDLFCYEGAFALALARAGAKCVEAVDLDELAIERAKANARRNQLDVAFRHGDAFVVLRERPDADFILLDPPRWLEAGGDDEAGKRRYLDLNAQAISVLPRGGLLMTSSCSGRLSTDAFLSILHRSALRAERSLRILEVRGAAPDHPVRADFPEGRYLTAVLGTVE